MPGGVCAVLDYETEMMAEYVAEMAMRVVMPNSVVTVTFRKFVSQILTSTRLPSTTILLGMNYLAKRINMLNAGGHFKAQEGQVWRMLTVALLLGSKFLDDNTFQNRSWSEVSSISVAELNSMENEWLRHINWVLYVNLDRSEDYKAWLDSWKSWQETKKAQQVAQQQQSARERLAPIHTSRRESIRQHHPLSYEGRTSEEISDYERRVGRSAKTASSYRPRENSWHGQYQNGWAQAPLTPPDSGYGTPEYLNSAASANARYNEWFTQAVNTGNYNSNRGFHSNNYSNRASTGSQYPSYFGHYGQSHWESPVADCNCTHCVSAFQPKQQPYFHGHQYGQPVVG
ncbi:PHO85 cyclin-5 [Microdochium nivale]|nr:PHO85 cyclin-5 [Microdochium nivale]